MTEEDKGESGKSGNLGDGESSILIIYRYIKVNQRLLTICAEGKQTLLRI